LGPTVNGYFTRKRQSIGSTAALAAAIPQIGIYMKLPATPIGNALVGMALVSCTVSLALPSDQSLLSLVPPGSQIVAGAIAPLESSHRGNFLLFTRANILDLEDFFSLAGADASVGIQQMIFAASAADGTSPEHSLVVIGHFDRERIYRAASATASPSNYHEISLVVVHPFGQERAILRGDRLLAIVNSRLAIFGTPLSAEEEIDRYLNSAPADAEIVQRLSQLQGQNETWCLITSLPLNAEIPRVLSKLDPAFSEIEASSDTLLFGIKYGRQIEFEYVIDARAGSQAVPLLAGPTERLFGSAGDSLYSASHSTTPTPGARRLLKVSKLRYQKWLAGLTQH